MRVGVAKEIKKHEYRVGLTPANAKAYISAGHQVVIEKGAGVRTRDFRTRHIWMPVRR